MLKKILIPALLLTMFAAISCSTRNYPLTSVSIIPQPQTLTYGESNVALPKVKEVIDPTLGEEEYKIDITSKCIKVSYATQTGLIWARHTVDQIVEQQAVVDGKPTVPQMSICDKPRYGWRGFHLDVARHMFPLDFIKNIIDCLSFYKINHLHLHLTDDQGWRIEIKKYPQLTEVGGWRTFDRNDERCIARSEKDPAYAIDPAFIRNSNEYGGYYTQEELKDLVEYAAQRGIEIVPEIDFPGHLTSAIKSFPEMQCNGETGWGTEFSFPICGGRDENVEMLKDIFDEVMEIFPGKYIHIGADEVNKEPWETCGTCQAKIKEQNLKDVVELCNYFVKQVADYLKSKGKTVMAWDDAFYADDPQDLVYTYWRDWLPDSPAAITSSGHKMVFMEWGHFYFGGRDTDKHLEELYNFDPDPMFPGIVKENLLGYQSCIWTETIPNTTILGRAMFPSLQALSEVCWCEERSWDSFLERLSWHLQRVESKGFTVRDTQYYIK